MKRLMVLLVLMALACVRGDALDDGFAKVPMASKPQTWWHWIDGNVTKEGIKADLEAMAKAGLGGATILDISGGLPSGPVQTLSDEWFELVEYAIEEASKLGLEITLHNCPGWSSSGGPWIPKEHGMKIITYSEIDVDGGKQISMELPKPGRNLDWYREIAVLAFPALPQGYNFPAMKGVKATTSLEGQDPYAVFNGPWNAMLKFPMRNQGVHHVTFEFLQPLTASMVRVTTAGSRYHGGALTMLTSDDGVNFTKVLAKNISSSLHNELSFPETKARFYRFEMIADNPEMLQVREIRLQPYMRVPNVRIRAAFDQGSIGDMGLEPTANNVIQEASILDISNKMNADGKLVWDAPAGKWTIMRFGYTLTGRRNHPTTKYGNGLECDKMSKAAVKVAWDGMMAKIAATASKHGVGKALEGALIDSYEVGSQNWTDTFREDFIRLRGYDCVKLLPAVSGRYIQSQDFTERYLADIRRTVADLFAECYAEYFHELTAQAGIKFFSEPYGGPFDEMLQGRYADLPMGEFWAGGNGCGNAALAGNLAQVNGKIYAGTESFTADPIGGKWQSQPATHKAQGDNAFANGINRFIYHSYAHQPWTVKGAGMTMGRWGFHFNRHNTLWPVYYGWLNYVGRSQFMLQQGRIVSDVLYIAKETAPCGMSMSPALPYGYHGNCVAVRTLLEQVRVQEDGRVALPHGLSFPVLVVNETDVISPEVLMKVRQLVTDGATVLLGRRPKSAFGLRNYPQSDADVAALTQALWGNLDGKTAVKRTIGKGCVYFGVGLQTIFDDLKLTPDFSFVSLQKKVNSKAIKYLHRRTEQADIYFVSNQMVQGCVLNAQFRTVGKVPELWDAETGKTMAAPVYTINNKGTAVELPLTEAGSLFVVFRRSADGVAGGPVAVSWKNAQTDAQAKLLILKAEYRALDGVGGKDVTAWLNELCVDGSLNVTASNADLKGDPTPMHKKELYVEYELNGKHFTKSVPENAELFISDSKSVGFGASVATNASGHRVLTAWRAGTASVQFADGHKSTIEVTSLPAPAVLNEAWNVTFPTYMVPAGRVDFAKLMSYTAHDNNDIRYFSGTASYRKSIEVPSDWIGRPLLLDLGTVCDIAEIFVNGEFVGICWKPPYSLELTGKLKSGRNDVEVRVTNRWINRLIGDEQLPDDAQWRQPEAATGSAALAAWPEWFQKGEPSPTGRKAFTTFKHWHKGDALKEAGLIGPVRLIAGEAKVIE